VIIKYLGFVMALFLLLSVVEEKDNYAEIWVCQLSRFLLTNRKEPSLIVL